MVNNYPDDIRQHDDNPDSPFYDDSREAWIEARTEEIKAAILDGAGHAFNGAQYDISDVMDRIFSDIQSIEDFEEAVRKQVEVSDDGCSMNIILAARDVSNIVTAHALQLAKQLAADELAAKENDCE